MRAYKLAAFIQEKIFSGQGNPGVIMKIKLLLYLSIITLAFNSNVCLGIEACMEIISIMKKAQEDANRLHASMCSGWDTTKRIGSFTFKATLTCWAAKSTYDLGSLVYNHETSLSKYIMPTIGIAVPVIIYKYMQDNNQIKNTIKEGCDKLEEGQKTTNKTVTDIQATQTEHTKSLATLTANQQTTNNIVAGIQETQSEHTLSLATLKNGQATQKALLQEISTLQTQLESSAGKTNELVSNLLITQTEHGLKLDNISGEQKQVSQNIIQLKSSIDQQLESLVKQVKANASNESLLQAEQQIEVLSTQINQMRSMLDNVPSLLRASEERIAKEFARQLTIAQTTLASQISNGFASMNRNISKNQQKSTPTHDQQYILPQSTTQATSAALSQKRPYLKLTLET